MVAGRRNNYLQNLNMNPTSNFVSTNGIQLHYLDYAGNGPTIILMHGLTANAYAFEGLIAAGLSPRFRVISIDLRGRGLSDKPSRGYNIPNHAKDIIGLLDHLGLERAIIGGHSFGGLLSVYLARHYPERISNVILLDAAAQMHPNTREMLEPAMSRLGKTFTSVEEYLQKIKDAPYNNFWDPAMEVYYRADVEVFANGSVKPRSRPENMSEAVYNVLKQPWLFYLSKIHKPTILINAPGIYTFNAPLLPEENARETCEQMQNCRYVAVPGNHQTMLYGEGAKQIVKAITDFLEESV
jgi:pimeloyl-ACP methyl ester carboxylesterase